MPKTPKTQETEVVVDIDLAGLDISVDMKREITVYRRLKPFIGLCLSLNHDINNPLTGVLSYAEILLSNVSNLTPDQRGDLEQLLKCAEKIQAQMDKLGDLKAALSSELDIAHLTETLERSPAS